MHRLEPRPASTVVLCRQTTEWPYKILLIKRSPHARFLPNAHVFPGGQVEDQDHERGSWYLTDQQSMARMSQYFSVPLPHLAAHIAAAVRETLEESGVSILIPGRQGLAGPMLDNIWPLSWWVTPPGEARRFDTWFFLATVSDDLIGSEFLENSEISEPRWLTPAQALKDHEAGVIFLAPPTRAILERMAHSDSLDQALKMVDKPLRPIHPRFVKHNHENLLVLPGHELHEDPQRSGFIMKTSYVFK